MRLCRDELSGHLLLESESYAEPTREGVDSQAANLTSVWDSSELAAIDIPPAQ